MCMRAIVRVLDRRGNGDLAQACEEMIVIVVVVIVGRGIGGRALPLSRTIFATKAAHSVTHVVMMYVCRTVTVSWLCPVQ